MKQEIYQRCYALCFNYKDYTPEQQRVAKNYIKRAAFAIYPVSEDRILELKRTMERIKFALDFIPTLKEEINEKMADLTR